MGIPGEEFDIALNRQKFLPTIVKYHYISICDLVRCLLSGVIWRCNLSVKRENIAMNNYYNRSPRSHCNLLVKSENIVMGEFPPKCTDLKNQEMPYMHFLAQKISTSNSVV